MWWACWLGYLGLRWVQVGLTIETTTDAALFNDIGTLVHLLDAAASLAAWRVVASVTKVQEHAHA